MLIRRSFWKATRKQACRWIPKNSLPFAPRMTPALPGIKLVRVLNLCYFVISVVKNLLLPPTPVARHCAEGTSATHGRTILWN